MRKLQRRMSAFLFALSAILFLWPLREAEVQWLVAVSADEFNDRVSQEIAHIATPSWIEKRLEILLAETPRDWEQIDILAQNTKVPPPLKARLDAARETDFSPSARAKRCAHCIWDATRCSVSTLLSCRLPVDLTFVGDLTALARGGWAGATGGDIDELDVALGAAGLTATALIPFTAGASAPVKLGTSTLRSAKAAGRLSPRLGKTLLNANGDELRRAVHTVGDVTREIGLHGTLHIMPQIETITDLGELARISRSLGPDTLRAYDILGSARLARLGVRISETMVQLAAGIAALTAACISLLSSITLTAIRRWLR